MPRYQPSDALQSPRFCGIRTFARLPYVTDTEEVDATVIGIPFDTGIGGDPATATAEFGQQIVSRVVETAGDVLKQLLQRPRA